MYGVGGIPHSQWGGTIEIVGGGGNTMYSSYLTRYNAMVNWQSPLEIEIMLDPSYESLSAEITVTGEISTTNNKVIFIVTNHQTDEYFSSVITYDEYNFNLNEIGACETFNYFIEPGSYNIDSLSVNVLVQSLSGNHQILQAGRVIVAEETAPLHVETINFDPVTVGESSVQTLLIFNYGDIPLTGMLFPPQGFIAPADFTIQAHTVGEIEIEFAPQQTILYDDILIVTTSHPDYPDFFITLTGEGVAGGEINYGDIDDNNVVQAYDASLVLNYVVGNDPLPEDPIPWEGWREERSDVDLNNMIQAYDASLILNYVVGNIPDLPWTSRSAKVPDSKITAKYQDGYLTLSVSGSFYSATLDLGTGINKIISLNDDIIFCEKRGKLAIASSKAISGALINIKMSKPVEITGTVNTRNGQIDYSAQDVPIATNIKSIYPNPFNPETTVSYQLAEDAAVKIAVYNVKGQFVELLVDEKMLQGEHQIVWKADNQSSGIYFFRLESDEYSHIQRIVLIK